MSMEFPVVQRYNSTNVRKGSEKANSIDALAIRKRVGQRWAGRGTNGIGLLLWCTCRQWVLQRVFSARADGNCEAYGGRDE
jgi:hypothetical protein